MPDFQTGWMWRILPCMKTRHFIEQSFYKVLLLLALTALVFGPVSARAQNEVIPYQAPTQADQGTSANATGADVPGEAKSGDQAPSQTQAQPRKRQRLLEDMDPIRDELVRINLASDLARCAAYFQIAAICLKAGGRMAPAKKYAELTDFTFQAAEELTDPETAQTEAEKHLGALSEVMDSDCSQITVLAARMSEFCNALLADPKPRKEYWEKRIKEE